MSETEARQTDADTSRTNADVAPAVSRPVGKLLHGDITDVVLRAFYRVYDTLGFGFLESVYCEALAIEFAAEGLAFVREAQIDVCYKGRRIGKFRADFLVEGCVIVEVKATETLAQAHRKQLRNCLQSSDREVGMLLHFGPKAHFERMIHTNERKSSQLPPAVFRRCP